MPLGRIPLRKALPLLLLCFLVSSGAFAQTGQGTIVGLVADSSGALIPNVAVQATNTETNFVYKSNSNNEGLYRVTYVNPGTYDVTFEVQGFKKLTKSGILVRSTETARADVTLDLGSVVETVEVKAETALLEVETSTTGHLATGEVVNKLPTPQQKAQGILYYMPGVSGQKGEGHGAGQRARSFNMSMDGVSSVQPVVGSLSTSTTLTTVVENISEVKVMTTVLPAEYGHSGGAIMNISYKGGTNQLHGLVAERYMSKGMLHRNWQDAARSQGSFGYHLMSGSLSGPVYIPKVYNGKNKTFFLAGFQRHHQKESDYGVAEVPSPEMYAGNFSFGGIGDPIYDPATTIKLANGNYSRTAFPGNQIPVSRFDPAVKKFLALNPWQPQNNRNGELYVDRTGVHKNFSYDTRARSYRTGYDFKIDQSFSDNHKFFGRYSDMRNRSLAGDLQQLYANRMLDYNFTAAPNDFHQLALSDTYMINPVTINEVRIGVSYRKATRFPSTTDQNWASQLGIPNVTGETFPSFLDASGANMYGRLPESPTKDVGINASLQENLTMVRGRHTFKMGYEFLRTLSNTTVPAQPSGRFWFGGTEFPFTPNTGNMFASFLLGGVARADFNKDLAEWLPRWTTNSTYFQDDWKLTRNITLNIGVRWQYETPYNTKYGQQSQFNPTVVDTLTGRMGALTHPTGALAKKDLNNFQPRVGMAYNFRPNWVFRGGFAINTLDVWTNGSLENFDDYMATTVVQAPTGDPNVAFFLSKGLPAPVQFAISSNGTSPFVGTNYSGRNASYYDPNMRAPYVMNWNAGFQHQLRGNMLVEFTYQASAGVGLLNRWDINAIPLNVSSDFNTLETIRKASQNYKPFPQFGAVNMYSNFGHNTYHSATIRFEKRYSAGMTLTSYFTKGKAIDESSSDGAASGITYYNRALEKGRADYDVANNWVTYFTYELPFGKGRKFGGNSGRLLNAIAGGWNLNIIQTLQSGAPVSFTQTGSSNVFLPGTLRPNMAPGKTYDAIQIPWDRHGPCRNSTACSLPWADINAFATPGSYQLGNAGRNIINGPGMIWHQGSIAKEFHFKERVKGTLRYDINNPFSRPFFSAPNSVVNFRNSQAFGKITGSQGSYSSMGGRTYMYVIFKLEF